MGAYEGGEAPFDRIHQASPPAARTTIAIAPPTSGTPSVGAGGDDALALGDAAATALADEASVRRGVEARFEGIKVDSVTKISYGGLYEIVVGETLFYTDETVNFVFKGEIIDARSQKNLTEERQQKLTAIKFEDLPLDLAIKQVRGNGKRVVAIFADPFCPYCKSLDRALLRQDDITIYTFLYRILGPNPRTRRVPSGARPTGPRPTTISC